MRRPSDWKVGAALMAIGFAANLVAGPEIMQQPADQIVAIGGEARFTVVATGTAPLSYQWTRNDLLLPGATHSYLRIWIGTQDNGVAVFREGGVILRPQMKSLIWDAQGRLVVRWNGGKPMYQVQSRASLDTGNWEDHGAPTDQQTLSVDATGSSRFFRVTDSQP